MTALFAPGAPKVWTIPPGENFLDELASALAHETGLRDDPEALADALIYVPNRRSERALAFALHRASGRDACLLPDIRALGDLETDEPPPSAEAALADLPPVIDAAHRIGALTRLVIAYYEANGTAIPPTSALSAARELARLLDQAALSGPVDWSQLKTLVRDTQLSRHWEQSAQFLEIITEQWPAKLQAAQAMDPYARRLAAAEAVAAHWRIHPPQGPVVIAGSTGATPASRLLMAASLDLPQGLVVLPGLDQEMPETVWAQVAETPSHPQFTLARTLKHLGLRSDAVVDLTSPQVSLAQQARRRLIHEALAPAKSTADWADRLADLAPQSNLPAFMRAGLSGLTLIEASDDHEEAMLAALLMRETLEDGEATAALVTPDAGLARHVSVLLRQWSIDVPPSAGLPLAQTGSGSLAVLVSTWLCDPSHPVALMAVLNHPECRFEPEHVRTLDRYFLRGPRLWQSWQALIAHIEALAAAPTRSGEDLKPLLSDVRPILNALSAMLSSEEMAEGGVGRSCDGPQWYQKVAATCEAIAKPPFPFAGEAGASLASCLRTLEALAEPLGHQSAQVWTDLLVQEAAQQSVPAGRAHPRLVIWGPLEARLQQADKIILAGLNEGIWPIQPAADAFLPRRFRQAIGLSDPDERIGLSAHDFAQYACAPNVTLLASKRRDDKPALLSRWLWRLQTLARGAIGDEAEALLAPAVDSDPRRWLSGFQAVAPLPASFTAEPRPTPPVSARPRGLSVTRIERLIRDPYAIYAQYVLKIYPLDRLNMPPDARGRGTAIHQALEQFEYAAGQDDPDRLLGLLEEALLAAGESRADLIGLRDRRRAVVADYINWREQMAPPFKGDPLTEAYGKIELMVKGDPFKLSATADRIERRPDGRLAILDFKSGAPPSERQVRSGLAPQMPLQGLIAQKGGWDGAGLPAAPVSELTYIRFGTQFDVREIGAGGRGQDAITAAELIDETEARLVALLAQFATPDHPYLSAPRPERVSYWSDYTRLARRDEWAGLGTYD